jgi:hypothetical protein
MGELAIRRSAILLTIPTVVREQTVWIYAIPASIARKTACQMPDAQLLVSRKLVDVLEGATLARPRSEMEGVAQVSSLLLPFFQTLLGVRVSARQPLVHTLSLLVNKIVLALSSLASADVDCPVGQGTFPGYG